MPIRDSQYECEHPFVQTDSGSIDIRQFQKNLVPPLAESYSDGRTGRKILILKFRLSMNASAGISPYRRQYFLIIQPST